MVRGQENGGNCLWGLQTSQWVLRSLLDNEQQKQQQQQQQGSRAAQRRAHPALNSLTKTKWESERAMALSESNSLAHRGSRCCDAIRKSRSKSKNNTKGLELGGWDSGRESESTSYANEFVVIAASAAALLTLPLPLASRRGLFYLIFFFVCILLSTLTLCLMGLTW